MVRTIRRGEALKKERRRKGGLKNADLISERERGGRDSCKHQSKKIREDVLLSVDLGAVVRHLFYTEKRKKKESPEQLWNFVYAQFIKREQQDQNNLTSKVHHKRKETVSTTQTSGSENGAPNPPRDSRRSGGLSA